MLLKTDSGAWVVVEVKAAGDEAADEEIDATRASIVDDGWVIGMRSGVVCKMVVVDGNAVLGVVGIGVDDVVAAIVVLVMNFFNLRTIIESAKFVVVDVAGVDDDWVDESVIYGAAARDTALAAVRTVLWTIFGK